MLTACDRAGDVQRAEEWTQLIARRRRHSSVTGHGRCTTHCCAWPYGSVLCAAGRWPEAEALMLEALGPAERPQRGAPGADDAHLAGLRLEQGRVDEAAELLAPFEDWVTVCVPLARVYRRRGEPELAAAVLRRGRASWSADAAPLCAGARHAGRRRAGAGRPGRRGRIGGRDLADQAAVVVLPPVRADAAVADGRVATSGGARWARAAFAQAKARLAGEDRPLDLGLVRLDRPGRCGRGDRPGGRQGSSRAGLFGGSAPPPLATPAARCGRWATPAGRGPGTAPRWRPHSPP